MEVTLVARFLDREHSGGNLLLQKLLHVPPTPLRENASLQPIGNYLFYWPKSLSLFSSCFAPQNTRSSHQSKSSALREVPIIDTLPFGSVLCVWHIYSDTWPLILSLSFGHGTVRWFGCPKQPDILWKWKSQDHRQPTVWVTHSFTLLIKHIIASVWCVVQIHVDLSKTVLGGLASSSIIIG